MKLFNLLKKRLVSGFVLLTVLFGIGEWTKQKILDPLNSDGWVIMNALIAMYYKEMVVVILVFLVAGGFLSRKGRKQLVAEAGLVRSAGASGGDLVVIGGILLMAGWVVLTGFKTARADFGMLRTGKGLYVEALADRLRLRSNDYFRAADYESAARLREAAGGLTRKEDDKKDAEEIRKVVRIQNQIVADLSEGRHCRLARHIFNELLTGENLHLRERANSLLAAKAEGFTKALAGMQASAAEGKWRECQRIFNELDRQGYQLASHGEFGNDLLRRLHHPDTPEGPEPSWTGESISSLSAGDGGVIPCEYVHCFARVSPPAYEFFERSTQGVYSAGRLPVVSREVDDGDELTGRANWWRFAALNGFQSVFEKTTDRVLDRVADPEHESGEIAEVAVSGGTIHAVRITEGGGKDREARTIVAEEPGEVIHLQESTEDVVLPLPDRRRIVGKSLVDLLRTRPHLAGQFIVENPESEEPEVGWPASPQSGDLYHRVKAGETLSSIAKLYYTKPDLISRYTDAKSLKAGDVVYVPIIAAAKIPAEMIQTKAGDMLPPLPDEVKGEKQGRSGSDLLRERLEEQERQLRQLEEENARLKTQQPGMVTPRVTRQAENAATSPPAARARAAAPAPKETSQKSNKGAAPAAAPALLVDGKPQVRLVVVEKVILFGEFAAAHGTTTARLNALNGHNLNPSTVLAKESAFYVPVQP